jgi:hypothetical protein
MSLVAVGALLITGHQPIEHVQNAFAVEPAGAVLAPMGRQVGWLSLTAPRRQVLTRLPDPAYVTNVAADLGLPFAVILVSSPFGHQGAAGDDLLRLDTASGSVSPFLERAHPQESITAPQWWPDGSGVLF